MHIPDAVLSPAVASTCGVLAAGGLGLALSRLRGELRDRTPVLMGIMAAFVFAAQMVNFPIPPGVASGHLLGGVLAAVLLGPWAGAVVIAAVLIVQCLLFADGGLTALGANFVNLGLIGSVLGYAIFAPLRRAIGGARGTLIAAMAAAWFSVILASGAFAVELAASGRAADFVRVLGWMALVHAAIGLGEAIITGVVLQSVLLARPDLIHDPDAVPPTAPVRWGQVVVAGLAVSLAVAVFLGPIASESPDGLEYVGELLGFLPEPEAAPEAAAEAPAGLPAPMPDYQLPIPGLPSLKVATAAAGAVGTLIVFGVALLLARGIARGRPEPVATADGVRPDAV